MNTNTTFNVTSEYKIGHTLYTVTTVFNPASKASLSDILKRLIMPCIRQCEHDIFLQSVFADLGIEFFDSRIVSLNCKNVLYFCNCSELPKILSAKAKCHKMEYQ